MQSQVSRLPTLSELEDLEYYLCASDWRYWIRNHGYIKDEGEGVIYGPGLDLWPGQWEFAEAYASGVSLISLKGRQLGFSWIATNLDCWEMMFHANVDLGCIAATDDDKTGSMFHKNRLQWVYDQQPRHIARAVPVLGQRNKHVLGLSNGSRFTAVASTGNVRGQAWKRTRLEEFAFMANAAEVWTAVSGQAGGKRQLAIISTANGEGGEYHDKWTKAVAGANGLTPIFLGWRANPARDDAWYLAESRNLGAKVKQEHPETPEDAFLGSGVKFFDVALLARLEDRLGRDPLRVILADNPPALLAGPGLAGMHCGLRIYSEPVAGRLYAVGADTADSGDDGCSCDVLDADTGEQVAKYLSYTDRAGEFGNALDFIGRMYNNALVAVERNNTGYATNQSLLGSRYPNLYRGDDGEPGWSTNNSSRMPMLDGLREGIGDGDVIIHDPETYRQLRIFGFHKKKWQHPDGEHDDSVFSLGIGRIARAAVLKQRQRKKTPAVYQDGKRIT